LKTNLYLLYVVSEKMDVRRFGQRCHQLKIVKFVLKSIEFIDQRSSEKKFKDLNALAFLNFELQSTKLTFRNIFLAISNKELVKFYLHLVLNNLSFSFRSTKFTLFENQKNDFLPGCNELRFISFLL